MKVKLNQLDVLLEVAAQGSIGKAARALHVTQPAISKTIQELESEIGMPILERSARGITLNAYGHVLLRHAKDIDHSLTRAREEIDELLGKAMRQLRIGVTSAAAYGPLSRTLQHYQAQYPSVKLMVMEGRPQQIIEYLHNQRLDIAVISGSNAWNVEPMYWEPLYSLSNGIIVGEHHPLKHVVSLKNLLDYTWLDGDEPGEHSILAQVFRRYNLPQPNQVVHCSSPLIMAQLLQETDMIGMWTSIRLRFPSLSSRLRTLDLREVLPTTDIGILCPYRNRLSSAGQNFLEQLRTHCRDWLQQEDAHEIVAHR